MTPEELQQIEDLSSQIKNLSDEIEILKEKPVILDRNLDTQSKIIIEDTVTDRITDIVWDDYFYYHTFFESIDAFDITGTVAAGAWGFTMTTAATTNARSRLQKQPTYQKILNFNKESRFRANFQLDSITSNDAVVAVGKVSTTPTFYYGFRVTNGTVKGITYDGTTETETTMTTITANTNHDYEARFYPGYKVDYFVDGIFYGSISTNLPTGTTNINFYEFDISTGEDVAKDMKISTFEYIQNR